MGLVVGCDHKCLVKLHECFGHRDLEDLKPYLLAKVYHSLELKDFPLLAKGN